MVPLLVLVTLGFVITLGLLIFGRSAPATHVPATAPGATAAAAGSGPDPELEKRRREVEELRSTVGELRSELKATKRRLHEQREADRGGADLVKARAEVERSASQQLEVVRSELAAALAEVGRLKGEAEAFRIRRPVPTPVAVAAPPAPVAPATAPEPAARRFRELSDTDREKMARLEHLANRERSRSQELAAEVRRLKGRTETQGRVYTVIKGELDLLKDKFKALEKRLNRTLLERDLLRRAIRDLEKKSGLAADRTELTADEVAASDRTVEERAAAEAAEFARRSRPLEPADPHGPAAAAAPVPVHEGIEATGTDHSEPPGPMLAAAEHEAEKAG